MSCYYLIFSDSLRDTLNQGRQTNIIWVNCNWIRIGVDNNGLKNYLPIFFIALQVMLDVCMRAFKSYYLPIDSVTLDLKIIIMNFYQLHNMHFK